VYRRVPRDQKPQAPVLQLLEYSSRRADRVGRPHLLRHYFNKGSGRRYLFQRFANLSGAVLRFFPVFCLYPWIVHRYTRSLPVADFNSGVGSRRREKLLRTKLHHFQRRIFLHPLRISFEAFNKAKNLCCKNKIFLSYSATFAGELFYSTKASNLRGLSLFEKAIFIQCVYNPIYWCCFFT